MSFKYPESDLQLKTRLRNFTYHAPHDDQQERYVQIRDNARMLSELFNGLCPSSRELSLAQTKLEEAVFWANAAIAKEF